MALVSEARAKTVSPVIGRAEGSLLRCPYAFRKTTSPPLTTAITAPGTSPRETAPLAASSIAAAAAGGDRRAGAIAAGDGAARRFVDRGRRRGRERRRGLRRGRCRRGRGRRRHERRCR